VLLYQTTLEKEFGGAHQFLTAFWNLRSARALLIPVPTTVLYLPLFDHGEMNLHMKTMFMYHAAPFSWDLHIANRWDGLILVDLVENCHGSRSARRVRRLSDLVWLYFLGIDTALSFDRGPRARDKNLDCWDDQRYHHLSKNPYSRKREKINNPEAKRNLLHIDRFAKVGMTSTYISSSLPGECEGILPWQSVRTPSTVNSQEPTRVRYKTVLDDIP
jgi:hypothetical protein